jgi:hypothetical protein
MIECNIKGELKIGANDKGETFVWWPAQDRWLTMDEFKKCEIQPGTKFVLYIKNEIKHKVVNKNVASNLNSISSTPFNSNINYSLSPSPLKIQKIEPIIYEQQTITESNPIAINNPTSISDLFVGGAAAIAMVMAVTQQIRQKKKEAEASLCCNNNKLEISKFDVKLQKLEAELKASHEKDNKGMIAEILETRKEIKDIKEEFESGKEDIQKLIEIINIQNQNSKERT